MTTTKIDLLALAGTCARDNLAAGKYENKVPMGTTAVPVDPDTMTINQAAAHRAAEKQRSRDQRELWRAENNRLALLLLADLELEHKTAGHPKADKLWSMAWDRGHSSGYESVIQEYEDLVEFIT